MYIISFAADHNDLSMLKKLRAREIPELYYKAHYLSCACPDFDIHYDKNKVSHIAKSGDKVLDYFTDPFEISIAHNESTKEKLKTLIKGSINNGCYHGDSWKKEVDFHENGNIIHFRDTLAIAGIITNIAKVTKKAKDIRINRLIERLNDSYNEIKHITEAEIALGVDDIV